MQWWLVLMGTMGDAPHRKINEKKTVHFSYNSEKNIKCYILACFTRHSGARDSITSHCVDLSLVRRHLRNNVCSG